MQLYLALIIISISLQNVFTQQFSRKENSPDTYMLFNFMKVFVAFIIFLLFSLKGYVLHRDTILLSCAFAISFSIAVTATYLAIANGSLSLTSLVISYALTIPTIYGMLFLHEPFTVNIGIGLFLLIVSLFFINQPLASCKITIKWMILVALSFLGNGISSTIQKVHQSMFPKMYQLEFMTTAMAIVTFLYFTRVLFLKKVHVVQGLQQGWHLASLSGIANAAVNYLVLLVSVHVPASIMFPVISAGGIITTYIVSTIALKERLSKQQIAGFVIGMISIVILNL